jgi:hypothetical protein
MKSFVTKGFMLLPDADEIRSNGCLDAFVVENESKTVQLEATVEELEDFDLDGDVIPDALMEKVLASLSDDGLLEETD